LSLTEFKEIFRVQCPFTIYYGLVNAIPKTWRSSLHNTTIPANRLTLGAPTTAQHLSTKLAYLKLLEKDTYHRQWNPVNHGFTKEGIQNVYLLPFHILKGKKIMMFQLKIIHGILPG